jgi:peptide/nickel transport system substrate-binding protein
MSQSKEQRLLTRREVLKGMGLATAGVAAQALLSACGPTPTEVPPTPTEAPPAPTPTEVPPTPTEAPPAPTPTEVPPTSAESALSGLIGELEGPEIITDPSRFPKTFSEAPDLAQLVKAGSLPPVADRIGLDPLVVKPVHEIGKYGGTLRRGFTGPNDKHNGYRIASGLDTLLFLDYTNQEVVPNIVKDYELQDDGRVVVLHLRREMKWSDGEPFTADDIMFWFEDMYQNEDLVPTPFVEMSINGQPGEVEKVDDYTVRFVFPEPYTLFPEVLATNQNVLGGHATQGSAGGGAFAPAHYLKQFHPKYTSAEELEKEVEEANFDNWVALFKFKNDWALNPELPVVTPWKTVTPANTPTWTLERNPYSIWVDTEGNQLPYIDKIVLTVGESLEIINLRAIAGEYDFQGRHIDLSKLPVLLENQEKGGYQVHLDTGAFGSDMLIQINQIYEEDPEIGKWLGTTDFRRALSLGMDRDQLNEALWLGLGTPGSNCPDVTTKYSPGAEYRDLWSTHDPEKANKMLDDLGLDEKDDEGYRLRTDGGGRLQLVITSISGTYFPFTKVAEMVKEQWKKIGIYLDIDEVDRSLAAQRTAANQTQLYTRPGDNADNLLINPETTFPTSTRSGGGPLYAQWFQSNGAKGKEPPEHLKEVYQMFRKAFSVSEEERIRLAKEIWKIALDQVYYLSTVGLSPSSGGVRVVNKDIGNSPSRQFLAGFTPAPSRPVTFFWKK